VNVKRFPRRRLWRRRLLRLHRATGGATAFEYALLVAVIAIPSAATIFVLLDLLAAHYEMGATLNALPVP